MKDTGHTSRWIQGPNPTLSEPGSSLSQKAGSPRCFLGSSSPETTVGPLGISGLASPSPTERLYSGPRSGSGPSGTSRTPRRKAVFLLLPHPHPVPKPLKLPPGVITAPHSRGRTAGRVSHRWLASPPDNSTLWVWHVPYVPMATGSLLPIMILLMKKAPPTWLTFTVLAGSTQFSAFLCGDLQGCSLLSPCALGLTLQGMQLSSCLVLRQRVCPLPSLARLGH